MGGVKDRVWTTPLSRHSSDRHSLGPYLPRPSLPTADHTPRSSRKRDPVLQTACYAVEMLSLSGHHVLNFCIIGESLYLGAMCFI